MTDTQYTAEELRLKSNLLWDDEVASMLRAGAEAIEDRDNMRGAWELERSHTAVQSLRAETAEARVKELEELLKECADGLSEYVEAHYASSKSYPGEMRRYERDIEPVIKARAALQVKP